MPQLNDLSRSLVALDQDGTIIAVVELSQSSWLVAGVLPGIESQPGKKLEPSAERLIRLLHRWRDEAVRAGKKNGFLQARPDGRQIDARDAAHRGISPLRAPTIRALGTVTRAAPTARRSGPGGRKRQSAAVARGDYGRRRHRPRLPPHHRQPTGSPSANPPARRRHRPRAR
jgi:hypothetical protein